MLFVKHTAIESFLNCVTNESLYKRKYIQMSASVMDQDIDLMAFSYMCLKTLAFDDMIDFTGFHHISSYAFVSNILYFTMFLISTAQPE